MYLIQLNNHNLRRSNCFHISEKLVLTINNVEYLLNKSFAVSISQKLCDQYILDNCIAKYALNIDIASSSTYGVLKDMLQYEKKEIECDVTVLQDIFHIGIALEMNELIDIYKKHVIDKKRLKPKNCIQFLDYYIFISADK